MRFWLGLLFVLVVAIGGSTWLWMTVWDHDVHRVNVYCRSLGAEPVFTHYTHALCVTTDGRIVGHI